MKTYKKTSAPEAEEPITFTESGELESIAMTNLSAYNEYHAMQEKIHRLESELAEAKYEHDEASRMLDEAASKIEKYEKAKAEEMVMDHEDIIASAFCEIAQRYLESNKRKRTDQRTSIKNSLHDIMCQLKMFGRTPQDLQKCINNFDDEVTPDIPQGLFLGTIIMDQHNDNYIGNVEHGGSGVIVNGIKKDQ